jgi:hypothetical protein
MQTAIGYLRVSTREQGRSGPTASGVTQIRMNPCKASYDLNSPLSPPIPLSASGPSARR